MIYNNNNNMFFLNLVIAFFFFILILCKIGIVNKHTSAKIFNGIYSLYSLNFTPDTEFNTQSCANFYSNSEQLETEERITIANYKYNSLKHFSNFISKYSNTNDEKVDTNFEYSEEDIQKIKEKLSKITNPTVKDLSRIIFSQNYKYQKYIKEIMQLLNYEIPIITLEQKKIIINHFQNNKIKFSRCKTGRPPYRSFYDICMETIKELNLPINLELTRIKDDVINEDYLHQKKNN
jgi:hypothetical protein